MWKDGDWYWILGIISAAAITISLMLGNILFAIFVLIATIVVGMVAQRRPNIIVVEINNEGIRVGNELYYYNTLTSFWVEGSDPDNPVLLFTTGPTLLTQQRIPVTRHHAPIAREFLIQNLPEIQQREVYIHRLMRYVGI